jgi:hypothetical protein
MVRVLDITLDPITALVVVLFVFLPFIAPLGMAALLGKKR